MRCSVPKCTSRSNGLISLFHCPRDIDRKVAWIQFLVNNGGVFKNVDSFKICELHFEEMDLLMVGNLKKLKNWAIPVFNNKDKRELNWVEDAKKTRESAYKVLSYKLQPDKLKFDRIIAPQKRATRSSTIITQITNPIQVNRVKHPRTTFGSTRSAFEDNLISLLGVHQISSNEIVKFSKSYKFRSPRSFADLKFLYDQLSIFCESAKEKLEKLCKVVETEVEALITYIEVNETEEDLRIPVPGSDDDDEIEIIEQPTVTIELLSEQEDEMNDCILQTAELEHQAESTENQDTEQEYKYESPSCIIVETDPELDGDVQTASLNSSSFCDETDEDSAKFLVINKVSSVNEQSQDDSNMDEYDNFAMESEALMATYSLDVVEGFTIQTFEPVTAPDIKIEPTELQLPNEPTSAHKFTVKKLRRSADPLSGHRSRINELHSRLLKRLKRVAKTFENEKTHK